MYKRWTLNANCSWSFHVRVSYDSLNKRKLGCLSISWYVCSNLIFEMRMHFSSKIFVLSRWWHWVTRPAGRPPGRPPYRTLGLIAPKLKGRFSKFFHQIVGLNELFPHVKFQPDIKFSYRKIIASKKNVYFIFWLFSAIGF